MSELFLLGTGFLAGVLAASRFRRGRKRETRHEGGRFDLVRAELDRDLDAARTQAESAPACNPAPHLLSLFAEALREPLRQLRREPARAAEVVERLERIVWQARMLVSRPRPMQAVPTSPVALLQEAAEEVPLLRDGIVTASWSLLNRQPIELDPERTRGAFRELLAAGAEAASKGGRLGIKILQGQDSCFPVRIEVEIGRRGTETDSLSFLVARHLLESQGAQLEVDGNLTRIQLRNAAPSGAELAA